MDGKTPFRNPVDLNRYAEIMHDIDTPWIERWHVSPIGRIPIVKSQLSHLDKWGCVRIRWGLQRMNYRVPPGIYGVGEPDATSPVLVTCNFKMTFDIVRRSMHGINAWVLVLDTKGINVWCAAGKGTFGTEALISQIHKFNLKALVNHNRLILPQLGGVGVAAHEVVRSTGFRVVYGPVYAGDLPVFLENDLKATPEMRRIHFAMKDRLALVPMEFMPAIKYAPIFLALTLIPVLVFRRPLLNAAIHEGLGMLTAIVTGSILFQIFLPWLPSRSFAVKGWVLGLVTVTVYAILIGLSGLPLLAQLLFLPPLAAYLALNFTGSTTYTSQSGVYQELKVALPLMIVSLAGGLALKFF